mgnify:CR=1 FL=1
MLRKLSYIIPISFFLLLCSCNSNTKNTDTISIGFSQSISEDDIWRKSMDHTMEIEASLHPEVKLTIYNADRNVKKQIADIDNMIQQGVDLIIIAPYESDSIVPVIDKAFIRGIPVIIIDRKVNTSNYTAFLGADNIEVGRLAGKHIASISNGHANVIEIDADLETSPGLERRIGFQQIVQQFPGIKVYSTESSDFGQSESNFSKLLDSVPNISYVYSFSDLIAYRAWKIAKEKGLEKKIKFIGVDGLNGPNGGIQLVKDGILEGTVLYPTGGAEAIRLALRIINKEIVSKNNKLSTTLIDSLNADIMSSQFDKISLQQSDIEKQQSFIREQDEKYSSQSSLLKISITLSILLFSLAVYSIYSRLTISKKKKELEKTNEKIISQRNEIEKFADELKQSNEARLNFFTGLSHEFKTPLTLILSSIESLGNEFKSKGISVNKEINLMYNNSRRLLRLINQLLDYRKIEDHKLTTPDSSLSRLIKYTPHILPITQLRFLLNNIPNFSVFDFTFKPGNDIEVEERSFLVGVFFQFDETFFYFDEFFFDVTWINGA